MNKLPLFENFSNKGMYASYPSAADYSDAMGDPGYLDREYSGDFRKDLAVIASKPSSILNVTIDDKDTMHTTNIKAEVYHSTISTDKGTIRMSHRVPTRDLAAIDFEGRIERGDYSLIMVDLSFAV